MTTRKQAAARFLGISASVVVIVGAVGGWMHSAKAATDNLATKAGVESSYVRKDSLNAWRSEMARRYSVDSTARIARDERIDTSLAVLVRACQRRGECP